MGVQDVGVTEASDLEVSTGARDRSEGTLGERLDDLRERRRVLLIEHAADIQEHGRHREEPYPGRG